MKKIAMLLSCDSFEKFFGGIFGLSRTDYVLRYRNDFAWSYATGLHRLGHQVTLYVFSYGPSELHLAPGGVRVRFVPLPRWLKWVDRVLYRAARLPPGVYIRDRTAYAGYRESLSSALLEDDIDVLYVQEIWTARFCILLENLQLPVIGADQGAIYNRTLVTRQRKLFPAAAAVVCQTEANFRQACALGARATLLSNAVDERFYAPPSSFDARPKVILAVGRLVEKQKRFSDIIKALALLSDFTITFAGSGPAERELRALAVELGVSSQVRFLGFVGDRVQMRKLYQECGVFVSSSSWEALALVILEAMSCAAPVVATRIPGSEALLSDGFNGRLVPVGNPELLAIAIRDAYENGRAMGEAARQTVLAGYTAEKLFHSFSALVEQSTRCFQNRVVGAAGS